VNQSSQTTPADKDGQRRMLELGRGGTLVAINAMRDHTPLVLIIDEIGNADHRAPRRGSSSSSSADHGQQEDKYEWVPLPDNSRAGVRIACVRFFLSDAPCIAVSSPGEPYVPAFEHFNPNAGEGGVKAGTEALPVDTGTEALSVHLTML